MTESDAARLAWTDVEQEAERLVDAAGRAGVTLRLAGSTGIRLHCPMARELMDRIGRRPKDIDAIASGRDRKRLRGMLEARGYEVDRDVLVAMEGGRFCMRHPDTGLELDVFFDRLEFCHTIELSKRLDHHRRTLPIADLLLQKLQVHDVTRTDILDSLVILATHDVRTDEDDAEAVEAGYIAQLLARDWGFYRTVSENLERIVAAAGELDRFEPDAGTLVTRRAGELRREIDRAPKSVAWRLRARVGDRMQWWDEVNERTRTY